MSENEVTFGQRQKIKLHLANVGEQGTFGQALCLSRIRHLAFLRSLYAVRAARVSPLVDAHPRS